MTTDVTTTNLKVNVLSRNQYEAITPNTDELYFVEEDDLHRIVGSVSDTAPASPQDGDTYINSTTKLLYTYSSVDSSWGDGEPLSEGTLYVDGTNNDVISSSLLGDASYCPSVALLLTDNTKFAGDLKYTHALAVPDMVL